MNKKELTNIYRSIGVENFNYTFIHYDDFHYVNDDEFHNLRIKYVESEKELRNYLDNKGDELNLDLDDFYI